MNELQDLIDNNERWADAIKQEDPDRKSTRLNSSHT